jgi:hypothetical protein
MNKLNSFIVVATADNIAKMSSEEINLLADLLADVDNGDRLATKIGFAIQDRDLFSIEVQEPVC